MVRGPQPGSVRSPVGDRAVVAAVGPGDDHLAPARADRDGPAPAAVVVGEPPPGAGGGPVGDRGGAVAAGPVGAGAGPGDEHRPAIAADGHRVGLVIAGAAGAVVARCPPHGAGRGLVGDRDVVIIGALHVKDGPGDEHRRAVRADGHRPGLGRAAGRSVVALGPQPGAGGGLVADRGELAPRPGPGPGAPPGDEHPGPVRAHRHRGGDIVGARRAVVPRDPQPAARGGRAGDVPAEPALATCAAAAAVPGGPVPLAPAALSAAPATTAAIPRAMFLCTVISPSLTRAAGTAQPRRLAPAGDLPHTAPVRSAARTHLAQRAQPACRRRRCGRGISRPVRGRTSSETCPHTSPLALMRLAVPELARAVENPPRS